MQVVYAPDRLHGDRTEHDREKIRQLTQHYPPS